MALFFVTIASKGSWLRAGPDYYWRREDGEKTERVMLVHVRRNYRDLRYEYVVAHLISLCSRTDRHRPEDPNA